MINSRMPSEDLLNGVRHIEAYKLGFSERVARELGERGLLRPYLGNQLLSILSELELEVSHTESRGILGRKYKITYLVSRRGEKQLEFTDLLRQGTNLRALESMRLYKPGKWESDIQTAYRKCMDIRDQQKMVSDLINKLGSASYTPEEFIGLIEALGDINETTKLLALSSDGESIFGALSLSYCALGRCKEAEFVAETFLSIYPENADLHLALGNLFLGALTNSNPPPKDSTSFLRKTIETTGNTGAELLESLKHSNPSLYRALTDKEYEQRANDTREILSQVTLEALDCSYDNACKKAGEQFREALRLSKSPKTSAQAKSAMANLVMNIKMRKH